MAGRLPGCAILLLERAAAPVADETCGTHIVQHLESRILGQASWAVVVFLLFVGFVQILHPFGEVEDAVFDGVNGCVEVYIIVVLVDRPLLALTSFLTRMATKNDQIRLACKFRARSLHCQQSVLLQFSAKFTQILLLHAQEQCEILVGQPADTSALIAQESECYTDAE